ncbi:MAG: hypothetical protein KC502_06120 [Myxococcales bacterium]|nr:hypothetical protein [Myxococcales bacterium]
MYVQQTRPVVSSLLLCGACVIFAMTGCGEADTKPDADANAGQVDAGADAVDTTGGPDTMWTGKCAAGPAFCDDGNPCTVDDCDPQLGCQTQPKDCTDTDPCTIDSCDVTSGDCKHIADKCDDGNDCTTGKCDPKQGCEFTPLDCADGDLCTSDGCSPLKGCLNTPLVCEDGVTCTADKCDPAKGCVHTKPAGAVCCEVPANCEDDNACTLHACNAGICSSTAVFNCCKENGDCDDDNPCTLDTCAKSTGQCSNTYQAADGCCQSDMDCNDKDSCTADICVKGQCGHEVQCCKTAADCDKGGAVGLCGAATCTEAGCGIVAKPGQGCCKTDVAKTGFESAGGWNAELITAAYGAWQLKSSGLSVAGKTAKTGVGGAIYTANSVATPGGQTVARLMLDEVELAPGVAPKLTFWIRALLVGGSLGDRLRVRLETSIGSWLVWQAKGSMGGFQKVELDLRGFAGRPATRKVRVVFEVVPNAVKSTFTKVWLDDIALTSACDAPAACASDKDCSDGLNATSETCSAGSCIYKIADAYCESTVACNDKSACTTDACTDFGCTNVPLPNCCTKSADCLDNNPCTTNYCSGLKCQMIVKPASVCCAETKDCDDGNPCTLDQCPAIGLACQHTQTDASCCATDVDCDDTDKCTVDRCTNNKCGHQNQCCKVDKDCDDKDDLCTTDKCDKGGLCSWTPTQAKGCCEPDMLKVDFEAGKTGGMTLTGSSKLSKWQVVTGKRSKSGKSALYYGNLAKGNFDDQKTSGSVTTPLLKLPGGEKLTLSFALWMHTESGSNYDKFEVWVDTPKKQVKVWSKGTKGFELKKWQDWKIDLSAWAGFDVKVRLLFDTNDSAANKMEGVYVDDVWLTRGCKKLTCNTKADCDDALAQTSEVCKAASCVYTW